MSERLAAVLKNLTRYLLGPLLLVGFANTLSDGGLERHFPQAAPYVRALSDLTVAVPLAAGGFILMFGALMWWLIRFMRERSILLNATVVEIRQDPYRPEKYQGEEARTIARPVVAFELDGVERRVPLQSASSSYEKLSPGEVLAVRVQPDEPDNVDLADSGKVIPWVFMAIGVALIAFFSWSMQPGWLAWLLAVMVVAALFKRAHAMLLGKLLQA